MMETRIVFGVIALATASGIHHPVPIHRDVGHLTAVLFQPLARVEDGVVLDLRRDQVGASIAIGLRDPLEGEVVRLGCAGGEHDLDGPTADEARHLRSGRLHRSRGGPPERVIPRCGIPELLQEVRPHRLEDLRRHRGCGVVIHINGKLQ